MYYIGAMLAIPFCVIGLIFQTLFIYFRVHKNYHRCTVFKSLASITFVIVGIVSTKIMSTYSELIILGLIFGAAGDVFLGIRYLLDGEAKKLIFVIGTSSFIIGHLCYLAAIIPYCTSRILYAIIIGAFVATVTLLWLYSVLDMDFKTKVFGGVYIGSILLMASFAATILIINPDLRTCQLFALGAFVFVISDIVWAFNNFSKPEKHKNWYGPVNLSLYYIAQLLIALSLYFLV